MNIKGQTIVLDNPWDYRRMVTPPPNSLAYSFQLQKKCELIRLPLIYSLTYSFSYTLYLACQSRRCSLRLTACHWWWSGSCRSPLPTDVHIITHIKFLFFLLIYEYSCSQKWKPQKWDLSKLGLFALGYTFGCTPIDWLSEWLTTGKLKWHSPDLRFRAFYACTGVSYFPTQILWTHALDFVRESWNGYHINNYVNMYPNTGYWSNYGTTILCFKHN